MHPDHLVERDLHVEVSSSISTSPRVRQLGAMFDVPPADKTSLTWDGRFVLDKPWNIGLIVGPSGSGKTTLLHELFGEPLEMSWDGASVIDDFAEQCRLNDIAKVCQAVGFNTIPAWLRPYDVLSTGEQFRVDVARRLLETEGTIAIDEFSSVVDRQVAQIGAHAVQKFVRRADRQLVAASCHYDIIEWLQPDWIFEPATMNLKWRRLRQRPSLDVTIGPVDRSAWALFAPFHYLTATCPRPARCWALWVGDRIAAMTAIIYRPNPHARNIYAGSRIVTLPDWQGLGLAMALIDTVGSIYKAAGKRLRVPPAHPSFIRSFDRSPMWKLGAKPMSQISQKTKTELGWRPGQRPCAIFEYVGPVADKEFAARSFEFWERRRYVGSMR